MHPPRPGGAHPTPRALGPAPAIRYGVALASAGAGVIHLSAASAHLEHPLVFAFFLGTGLLQVGWGVLVAAPLRLPRLLQAGIWGNAAIVAIWVASRLSGLPFVAGAEHREPVGVKDGVAVLLELIVISGAWLLWRKRPGSLLRVRVPERALAPMAMATVVLVAGGVVAPAHHHSHEADGGHAHSALASSHSHEDEDGTGSHDHGDEADGRGHSSHTSATHAQDHVHAETPRAAAAPAAAAAPEPPQEVSGIKASVRYGPFFLPPAGLGGEAHFNRVLTNVAKPCTDCYIVRARPDLVYEDGKNANLDTGAMLHHAVWTRPSIRDTTCGRNSAIGSQGMRFFASGNERTGMDLPPGFGYHIGNDPWNLIVEIMNHGQQPRSVYITLDVLYRPGSEEINDVTPVWLDVDNCGDSEYSIPAGRSHTVWRWTSALTGRIVSTGGHVHDGGIKTVLTNETTGEEMCHSVAGYGTKPEFAGTIESMSTCTWDRLGTVRAGEELGLHAHYDSPQPQSDAMGIMIALVYETDDLSGGTPYSEEPPAEPTPPGHGHDHDH